MSGRNGNGGTPTLAGLTHLSDAQIQMVDHLWEMTGECAGRCGTVMDFKSPKCAMAVINSRHCVIPQVRNTVGISLYCGSCTQKLNALIRQLHPPTKEDIDRA